MNEARRFIRYVLPGLIFSIQLGILLLILRQEWVTKAVSELKGDSGLKGNSGLGLVFSALLVSGGLGAFFSSIHHALFWRDSCKLMDHTGVLEKLEVDGLLGFRWKASAKLNRKQAWSILTALWHQRVGTSEKLKAVNEVTQGLVDQLHSLGTQYVAAAAAAIVAFFVLFLSSPFKDMNPMDWGTFIPAMNDHLLGKGGAEWARLILAAALAFLVPWFFRGNYHRVAQLTQQVIDQALVDTINDDPKAFNPGKVIAGPFLH